MTQAFGILGFLLSLLALFFASEVMRRASHRQATLELELFKVTTRVQQIEGKMAHVDRLATEIRYEKKRQAETINAMAQKGEIKTTPAPAPAPAATPATAARERADTDRFTPSTHKRQTG